MPFLVDQESCQARPLDQKVGSGLATGCPQPPSVPINVSLLVNEGSEGDLLSWSPLASAA